MSTGAAAPETTPGGPERPPAQDGAAESDGEGGGVNEPVKTKPPPISFQGAELPRRSLARVNVRYSYPTHLSNLLHATCPITRAR